MKYMGIRFMIGFFTLKHSKSCITKKTMERISPKYGAVLGSSKINMFTSPIFPTGYSSLLLIFNLNLLHWYFAGHVLPGEAE